MNDLRDKRLLTFDSAKLTRVELISSKGDVGFGKNNSGDWQIIKPQPYRADSFQVEELVRKLGDAKMDLSASADDQKKADAAFANGQLVATAKVTDASGTQTLEVRKNKRRLLRSQQRCKGRLQSHIGSWDRRSKERSTISGTRRSSTSDSAIRRRSKIQQGASDKTYVFERHRLEAQRQDDGFRNSAGVDRQAARSGGNQIRDGRLYYAGRHHYGHL